MISMLGFPYTLPGCLPKRGKTDLGWMPSISASCYISPSNVISTPTVAPPGRVTNGSVEDFVGTWQLFDDTSGLPMTDSAVIGLTRWLLLVDDLADHEIRLTVRAKSRIKTFA